MLQDLSSELPSAAKVKMVAFFLKKLCDSKLNFRGEPFYSLVDALGEVHDQDSVWVRTHATECYRDAYAKYDCLHPKKYIKREDAGFEFYREGIENNSEISDNV